MEKKSLSNAVYVGVMALAIASIVILQTKQSPYAAFISPFDWLMLCMGLAGIFAISFSLAKLVFPDEEKLAAQRRLGVDDAIKEHKQSILRWLSPLYRLFLPRIQQMNLHKYRAKMKRYFLSAGLEDEMTPDEFLAFKALMAILVPIFGIFLMVDLGFSVTWLPVVGLIAAGFFAPNYWAHALKSERIRKIQRQLPHVIDLLTLSVEAGQDFLAALTKVVTKSKPGPLVEEMQKMLREIQLGMRRSDALRNLANRVNITELSSFATILIQADQLGASIGPVLRAQADQLRTNRFQIAEQMGAKAASKILIPMIIFVLPSVFIAILGPVGLNIIYNMKLGQMFGSGG